MLLYLNDPGLLLILPRRRRGTFVIVFVIATALLRATQCRALPCHNPSKIKTYIKMTFLTTYYSVTREKGLLFSTTCCTPNPKKSCFWPDARRCVPRWRKRPRCGTWSLYAMALLLRRYPTDSGFPPYFAPILQPPFITPPVYVSFKCSNGLKSQFCKRPKKYSAR